MCVIIAKKAGVDPLKPEYFDRAWERNSHGGGVVFKRPGEPVKMKKGFMDKKEFLDYLEELNKKDVSFIAHFRIKSVGEVKPENCHPFVLKNVTFAHNGTLHIQPLEGKTDSETFGLAVFKNHTLNWIKENQLLIEMALDHSKFAVMDNKTGEIFILNKEYGSERDGAWFSNESAFPPEKPATYSYRGGNYGGGVYDADFWGTSSKYKGLKGFGTKQHKEYGATFDKTTGVWVNDYNKKARKPMFLDDKVITNQKGLVVLAKSVIPDANFADHQYMPNEDVIKLVQDEQLIINKMLEEYRNTEYSSYSDRDDAEMEIKERYFVLNGIRRLISARKLVNADSIYGYIYGNVNPDDTLMSEYLTRKFNEFDVAISDLCEEWCYQLGMFEDNEVEQKAAMAA